MFKKYNWTPIFQEETEKVTDIPAPVVESEDEKEATPAATVQKQDKASEMATQSLLNEAIDAMLSIKKRKEDDAPVNQVCCVQLKFVPFSMPWSKPC